MDDHMQLNDVGYSAAEVIVELAVVNVLNVNKSVF